MSDNRLRILPEQLATLPQLVNLIFRKNEFSVFPPVFQPMGKQIEVLDMSENYLEGISAKFKTLVRLKELRLASNKFPVVPLVVRKFKRLELLDVNANDLLSLP